MDQAIVILVLLQISRVRDHEVKGHAHPRDLQAQSLRGANSLPHRAIARIIHESRRESVQVVCWQGRARTRPEATFVVAEDRARSSDAGSGRVGRSQQRVCE